MEIITRFDPPPIPIKNSDWVATTDSYEPEDPVGRGATEQEAIDDLLDQLAWAEWRRENPNFGVVNEAVQVSSGQSVPLA